MPLKINIRQGDITAADSEAIVNAANNHLWMGSGVAGAIKRKGGDVIEREAMARGPVRVGEAVATTAGKLPFKYVIHAAGMGQDLLTNETIVREVTRNSVLLADKLSLKSLAFPAIGTGVGGMELSACAIAMIGAVREIETTLKSLNRVDFVLFDAASLEIFQKIYRKFL